MSVARTTLPATRAHARAFAAALALVAVWALAVAAPAGAVPCAERCRSFDAPGAAGAVAKGPDGNLWYAGNGAIGRITPAGEVARFAAPTTSASDLEAGPDGGLWFTAPGLVGRMATDGTVTLTRSVAGTPGPIAPAADGAMWFTASGGVVSRVAPDGGLARLLVPGRNNPSPTTRATGGAGSMVAGPDGALWFAMGNPAALGRIGADGKVTEHPLPGIGRQELGGVAAGPDGGLWFTVPNARLVGRLSPTTGRTITFRTSWNPHAIAAGPSHAIWFAMTDSGRWTVTRMVPAGYMTFFQVPGPVRGLAAGADYGIWMAGDQEIERLESFMGAHPIRTRRLKVNPFAGSTSLRLLCPKYDLVLCAGTVTLGANGRKIGSAPFSQRSFDAPATRILLNRLGRRLTSRRREVEVVATLDQRDAGGTRRVARYAFTLVNRRVR
jgi:virginiamycin B lyase